MMTTLNRDFVTTALDMTGYVGPEADGVCWDNGPVLVWDGVTESDPVHEIRHDSWESLFRSLAEQMRRELADEQAEGIIAEAKSKGIPIN